MDKFEELLQSLRDEQNLVISEYQSKKAELEDKIAKNVEKKKDLEKRETELEVKEKEFSKKESSVNEKMAKIMSDDQCRAKWEEINTLIGVNEELVKQAKDHEAEAEVKLEEVAKKELAVQERERTYEEKIRKQFSDKLFK